MILLRKLPQKVRDRTEVSYGRMRMALDSKNYAEARAIAVSILNVVKEEYSQEAVDELLYQMISSRSIFRKFEGAIKSVTTISLSILLVISLLQRVMA